MNHRDIITKILESKNMKYSELAFKLNVNRQVLYERLTQKNISIEKLQEMLKILGFKIIIVPYNTKIKEDWYEIE